MRAGANSSVVRESQSVTLCSTASPMSCHWLMVRANFNPFGAFIMPLTRRAFAASSLALLAIPARAQQLDKVSFGTNWVAEAEHGGFYQALADGTYRKYGLDVTIVPGGPQVNNRMLLLAAKIDFFMSANSLQGFDAVAQNIPTIAVAAAFQKDPQVLLAHPGVAEKFEDLKKLTLLVSSEGLQYQQARHWQSQRYWWESRKSIPTRTRSSQLA